MDPRSTKTTRRFSSARRDVVVVVAVSVVISTVLAKLNLSEALFAWTRPLERFQLDELPFVLLVIAICLVWFSLRRYFEAQRELALRRITEAKLEATLADNRRLAQQYVESQELERKALARDLHDEMGQYLNVIKLDALSLRAATVKSDAATQEGVRAVIQNVDRVYGVVTGLIRQLRPVVLDELGLNAALQQCVADWCRRLPKTVIALTISADIDDLDESRSLVLFRLVQEALTNMARHSHANHVDVKIGRERARESTAEAIVISIADDGIGTDLTRPRTGLGLLGMSERLATIGGLLTILSAPGKGFTVSALVPVMPAASREGQATGSLFKP